MFGEWKLAMFALAPFLRRREMWRTWLAMLGASLATFFVQDPVGYMTIDAIAAAVVMARPSGFAQRAIGALFVIMVMFDLGYCLTPAANWDAFAGAVTRIGWVQWLVLGAWTGHDGWRRYREWSDAPDRIPAAYKRRA